VCVDLALPLAQNTVALITAEGHGAGLALAADVTVPADCQRVVDTTVSTYGRLDILVNNVGITGPKGSAVDVEWGAFMRGMEANVGSLVLMAKYAVPVMARNAGQCAGAVVNMGSVAGLVGGTPNLLYPTSKGAVFNMTRAMAANHAGGRVRLNCLCPGM
jgi:NAD(P)-dependent dehydrogenase (short-subunit alcohol dehydrogenase family)